VITDQTTLLNRFASTVLSGWRSPNALSASLLALTFGLLCPASIQAQTTTYSPVVGFVKVTLQGTSGGSGENFVAPALLEQEDFRGLTVTGVPVANTLQAVTAAWTTNQFDTHATRNSHFVEIVASSNPGAVGLFSDIVSHTADTLTTADNLASQLAGGETIVVRAHKTVAKLFGALNESGLAQGSSTAADTVSVLTPGTNASFTSLYYRFNDGGADGWRTTSNPITDQGSRPIRIGDGLLVTRRQAAPLEIVIEGYVHEGPLQIPLKTGYNLIDPVAPITNQTANGGPTFTLGGTSSSTVIPSGLDTVMDEGEVTTADVMSFGSGTGFTSYYQLAPGAFGSGWRTVTNPIVNRDAVIVPSNTSLLLQIKGAGGNWNRPQPFTIP
jgi:hypothetical protein